MSAFHRYVYSLAYCYLLLILTASGAPMESEDADASPNNVSSKKMGRFLVTFSNTNKSPPVLVPKEVSEVQVIPLNTEADSSSSSSTWVQNPVFSLSTSLVDETTINEEPYPNPVTWNQIPEGWEEDLEEEDCKIEKM